MPRNFRFEALEARLMLNAGPLVISELLAINHNGLRDADLDRRDWIEIHNPTEADIHLDGWFLTDDDDDLTKWPFPDLWIEPDEYLVVFASGKDRTDPAELHTNFSLDGDGEYLALCSGTPVAPDGTGGVTVAYEYAPRFPRQLADVSYGVPNATALWPALVAPGTAANYHVPTAGEDVFAWTAADYDDADWTDAIVVEQSELVITEIETGGTDWIEIQNISDGAIDTAGWFVALGGGPGEGGSSGSIHDVHETVWHLPDSIAAGEVLYKTDDTGDNYFGSDISWDDDVGWAMIVDAAGEAVDFLPWGYEEAEIATLEVDAGGFDNIAVGRQWNGASQTITRDRWNVDNPGLDIGGPSQAGSYTYNAAAGTFTVRGGGGDVWGAADQFYYVHQPFSGDGQVVAKVNSVDNMIRESLDPGSRYAMTDVTAANGVSFQRRRETDSNSNHNTTGGLHAPYWVKLVRQGDTFTSYRSPDGSTWTQINTDVVTMPGTVYVGLSVSAHNDSGPLCTAVFQDVSVSYAEPATTLTRAGNADGNTADDFVAATTQSKGTQNPGLSVPFADASIPVTTAIGFHDGQPELATLIRTDVAEAMQGVNAALWSRVQFDVEEPALFEQLMLRMKYDDGFVAYLNGQEVARRNALDPLAFDSAATEAHPHVQAIEFEEIDISQHLGTLLPGNNVLAIHGLNVAAGDNDFLILPELTALVDQGHAQYMIEPTPGAENVPGALGLVADTNFSIDRGLFTDPFEVELATDTAGAKIYYTTDGSEPDSTAVAATLYAGPIPVDTTTTLRAAAFKPGYLPTNVDTHTYIFPADVVRQSAMSTAITDDPVWGPQVQDALSEIPTISLVTPHTISQTERETSIEMIFPDGSPGFQVDAGVEQYGGHSLNYPKKSMRISFKRIYGPGRLNFDVFDGAPAGNGATDQFDQLLLRTGSHDTMFWIQPGTSARGTYLRNRWIWDRQLEMGQPAPHGRFVHVYINGEYWGQHQLVERANAAFMASYFGGDKEDYDALNAGSAIDGDTAAYNAMKASTADYEALQQYMDVVNYADYMLLQFYVGNDWDWRHSQNWMAARKREPGAGCKFFAWDSDVILRTGLGANVLTKGGPGNMWGSVIQHEEFKMLLADRAQKYFFNGGMLTRDRVLADFDELASQIETTVTAECARWGVPRNYTPDTWREAVDWIETALVQQRTEVVIQQMRDAGILPGINAPAFDQLAVGEYSAGIDAESPLTMSVSAGTGFYNDMVVLPAFTGGTYFVPTDDTLGTSWTQRDFDDDSWTAGTTGMGYENGSGYDDEINTIVRPQDVDSAATSIFMRVPFTVGDLDDVDRLVLRMKYDDGFVAYINGREVYRRNISGSPPSWNAGASSHEANAFEDFDISGYLYTLVEGNENVLAIHGVNTGPGSSDMVILPELVAGTFIEDPIGPTMYYTTDGSDPRLPGGAVNWNSAVAYDDNDPISLTESAVVKTRSYQNGQWSALNEAEFFVGPQATAENLVITEINYNPYDPPEDDHTYDDNDFEFIELYNRGDETIDLRGLEFTETVALDFAEGEVSYLPPEEFVVVVANEAAFAERYETDGTLIAGQFTGRLDNGGEPIELLDWRGEPIAAFAYNDAGDWPGRADGKGASLELIDPAGVPQADPDRTLYLERGDNWRSSGEYGGSPGTAGSGVLGDVVINEVLSHTDYPSSDAIELYNTTEAAITIGGWYLSDSSDDYLKFSIPDGTSIPAGEYVVFDEDDFNPTPLAPGPHDFALDGAHGEDVWLMEADAADNLVRFVDHVEFGSAANGESFGRWPHAVGDLYPMIRPTLGPVDHENAGPRIGPVLISEVHYNHDPDPAVDDKNLEFVEIYNPTNGTIDLTDWRIRKGIDYNFPDDLLLGSGETLVVVAFDPDEDTDLLAAFHAAYEIDDSVRILGGYSGRLSDDGERVQLQRADEPPQDEPDFHPHPVEDEVRYGNLAPWPAEADGGGSSLNRTGGNRWGNDSESWLAFAPTPGSTPLLTAATVVGRHVFYNNSAFDLQDDGNAIAHDKQALLPGGTATFANYTSYDKGINGVMVDLAGVAVDTLGPADFRFRVGNDDAPGNWVDAPIPSITVHRGEGIEGSNRVKIIFGDGAIRNRWLEVTVLSGGNTNLAVDDVFYFGNAVAESGNSPGNTGVNAVDVLLARNNPRGFLNSAPIDFRYDFNRDERVNATDMLIARSNQTHFLDALKLISVPTGKGLVSQNHPQVSLDKIGPDEAAWLYETERIGRPLKKDHATERAIEELLATSLLHWR